MFCLYELSIITYKSDIFVFLHNFASCRPAYILQKIISVNLFDLDISYNVM